MAGNEDIALTMERQAAARRLLARPLLTARDHPEDFGLVRAHADWLISGFHRLLGYRLTVADGFARLAKTGLVESVTRPLTRPSGADFTPRCYTYLTLALAALLEAPSQVSLRWLVAEVRAAAAEAGLELDPAARLAERRALADALIRLTGWGALTQRSGDLEGFTVNASEDGWFDVHGAAVQSLLTDPPRSASETDRAHHLLDDRSEENRTTSPELAVRRRLAETAVVYREELDERRREWLGRQQWQAVAELGALLGCDAEIRAEGVALLAPEEDGEISFPTVDPVGQAALLLITRLTAALRPDRSPVTSVAIPPDLLEAELSRLDAHEVARHWPRAAVSHIPDPAILADRVLKLLADCRLLAPEENGDTSSRGTWLLLAAAARYDAALGGAGPAT